MTGTRFGRLLAGLDGATLRELAAIADARDRPVYRDPEAFLEQLCEMLERGEVPAAGFYLRHLVPRPLPSGNPADWPRRPSPPRVYVRTIKRMVVDGYGRKGAAEVVAQIAFDDDVERRLVREIVARALAELREVA